MLEAFEDWSSDEPASLLGVALWMMTGWLAGVGFLKFGGGVGGSPPPPPPLPPCVRTKNY